MQKCTKIILDAGLKQHVLSDNELEYLLNSTQASRHALIHKALTENELIRIKRGLYILNSEISGIKWSKFHIANQALPHSYITAETALAYHNWIPESVTTVISTTARTRFKKYTTPFGELLYYPIPIHDYEFYTSIKRVTLDQYSFLIATPLRALLAYVYIRKQDWQGLHFLTDSLRIEFDNINAIDYREIIKLKRVYRSNRVKYFLDKLTEEVFV